MSVRRSVLYGFWIVSITFCIGLQAAENAAKPTSEEATPPPAATSQQELTVDQILAETLQEEDYGDVTRCIDIKRISDSKILDRQHVAFKRSNRHIYIAKLIPPCRSLDYDDVLSITSNSGRLCRLDTINTIDRASHIPGVPCQIDSFRQVSKEQYDFLRAELKKLRR